MGGRKGEYFLLPGDGLADQTKAEKPLSVWAPSQSKAGFGDVCWSPCIPSGVETNSWDGKEHRAKWFVCSAVF